MGHKLSNKLIFFCHLSVLVRDDNGNIYLIIILIRNKYMSSKQKEGGKEKEIKKQLTRRGPAVEVKEQRGANPASATMAKSIAFLRMLAARRPPPVPRIRRRLRHCPSGVESQVRAPFP